MVRVGKVSFWAFLIFIVFVWIGNAYAKYTDSGIRYWSAPDHTRLVIAIEDECKVEWSLRNDPKRLEIRLEKSVKDWTEPFIFVEDRFIDHIAYLQSDKAQVVIVFFKGGKDFEVNVFTLKRAEGKPFRVVVDVIPSIEERLKFERERILEAERIRKDNKYIVVVDPGHGGNDPGAIGVNGIMEKDVVLDIAKKVKSICGNSSNFKVVLTREEDYFVPLEKRVKFARDYKADLFISIHANSAPNRSYDGFMAFVLAPRGARGGIERFLQEAENREVANELKNHHDSVVKVLLDFTYEYTMVEGKRAAKFILDEVDEYTSFKNRGVKEAGFYVLRNPGIPAVLLEVGFLSNEADVKKLSDESERKRVALAICNGVRRYFEHLRSVKNITSKVIDKNYSTKNNKVKEEVKVVDSEKARSAKSVRFKESSSGTGDAKIYVVKKGDTLFSISRLFGISVDEIIKFNRIRQYIVYPGMKILIPVR
ncbi:MAG: N-acetylmuramoyl-L-alanine amidase [Thermosulfidibacteraceae bacterium]|jgi:N-acetylmuramoyl-L-alanine amidase